MKRPFLVSLSGMDGSGKTQLVVLLRRFFRRQGISYLYIHSVRDSFANRIAKKIPSFKNLIGSKKASFDSGQNSPITPLKTKKISSLSLFIRIITIVLDALYFWIRLNTSWKNHDVIIFDRYIYDRIIQISYLKRKKSVLSFSWLTKLFPRPNMPLLLYITPELAMERKQDAQLEGQELEYFQSKHRLFEDGRELWKLLTIDNSVLSLSESKKKMISIFKKRYYRKFKQ